MKSYFGTLIELYLPKITTKKNGTLPGGGGDVPLKKRLIKAILC